MTREKDIKKLRALLQQRRRALLSASSATHGELGALANQERDPEYEENAQRELADYTLFHLAENQRRELLQIDAAFERMDAGSYGQCVECGQPIPLERLWALPFALRCEEDASRHEAELRTTPYSLPSL